MRMKQRELGKGGENREGTKCLRETHLQTWMFVWSVHSKGPPICPSHAICRLLEKPRFIYQYYHIRVLS